MKRSANSAGEVAGGRLRFGVVELADVKRIHELSLRVLAETGILLHYPPARQILAAHGARVDETRQVVRIPRQLVEQAMASAPREVTVYGRATRTSWRSTPWRTSATSTTSRRWPIG